MYFYDTETCGFHGVPIIIQYAKDDGPVVVHDVWEKPACETIELIESMMSEGVCGYNLTFDHFHLQKIYNMLILADEDTIPMKNVHLMYELESEARFGPCIKPYEVVDLMLTVRKSELQQSMGKKEIRINRVPVQLVAETIQYLNNACHFESYLHVSDESIWRSEVIRNSKKEWVHRDFRDVVGSFKSSGGLKPICAHVFGLPTKHFKEIMPDTKPVELGYIPFAKRIVEMDGWPTKDPPKNMVGKYKGTWPTYIYEHISHWRQAAPRKYAVEDVVWTRKLYEYFDAPEMNKDSELTCSVASCRWRGFDLDVDKIEDLRNSILEEVDSRLLSASRAREYLMSSMTKFEIDRYMAQEKVEGKTNKPALDQLAKWIEPCDNCLENGFDGCPECPPHEVARKALQIKHSREMNAKAAVLKKLLLAQRLYPNYSVIGTKSSRMSGAGGLNPQGIDRSDEVRSCFTLGPNLMGGDFSGFELTICDAVYDDPAWHEMLVSGQKAHIVFGSQLYDKPYEEIAEDKDLYSKGKSGLFALVYGGTSFTIKHRLEATEEQAKRAESAFFKRFPAFLKRREEILDLFTPLKTDHSWQEPMEYLESFMGHRRYFLFEWKVCRVLYNLASDMPFERAGEASCQRFEGGRIQSVSNALKSALHGAIRKVQNKASRAAINQEIQSPGADITKTLQKNIWDLQPKGVHEWKVQLMNAHDEIICVVHDPAYKPLVRQVVEETITNLREKVPLLKMEWGEGPNWNAIH